MERLEEFVGAAYQAARRKYGGNMRFERDVISVGTSVTQVATNDPERVVLALINLSTQSLYVAPDNAVSSTRCIILAGSGGNITLDADEDTILVASEWFALANLAAQTVYRITVRRDTYKT